MRWFLWCFCLLAESYETINHYHFQWNKFIIPSLSCVKYLSTQARKLYAAAASMSTISVHQMQAVWFGVHCVFSSLHQVDIWIASLFFIEITLYFYWNRRQIRFVWVHVRPIAPLDFVVEPAVLGGPHAVQIMRW